MLNRTYNQLQSRPVGKAQAGAPGGASALLGADPQMLQRQQQAMAQQASQNRQMLGQRTAAPAQAGGPPGMGLDPQMLQMIQQRMGVGGQAPGMQAPLAYKPFLGQQAPPGGMGRNMAMQPPGAVAPGAPGQMPPQALQGILATLAARRMG